MADNVSDLVEEWFLACDGDGEFSASTRTMPFMAIAPALESEYVLFTTKPALLATAFDGEGSGVFGMIGRYGLPNRLDLEWILQIAGSRALGFLGDMDPVDLLVFAWLRESARPRQVTYLGISDALFDALHMAIPDVSSIPCSASEQKAIPLLSRVFPDYARKVGACCSHTLAQGRKIELEAIVGASTVPLLPSLARNWTDEC